MVEGKRGPMPRLFSFKRHAPAFVPPPPDPFQGAMLLDNTTIFGARRAAEWDPLMPRTLPPGVDLRSLMDILEAIVLVNSMVVDASSREYAAWPALNKLSALSSSFYRDTDVAEAFFDSSLEMELFRLSVQKVNNLVRSGDLQSELGFLPSMHEVAVLPDVYHGPDDFIDKTTGSFGYYCKDPHRLAELRTLLEDFTRGLKGLPSSLQNFALFAFRGFYYQELAHLISISYMPHSWRSGLIRSQLDQPVIRFKDVVIGAAGRVRKELETSINNEFGTPVISADFPLIASFIVSQTNRRSDLLETAVQVRNSSKAAAFRSWVYEIEHDIRNQQDLNKIKGAQDELTTLVRELEIDLGLRKKPTQEVKLKLGLPLPVSPTAESSLRVGLPNWVRRVVRRRAHLVFLRNVAQESVSLPPFIRTYQALKP
ncbi:hypothetical protein ACIA5C_19120 [Actinoplanes sp. NPDC051343]|uniref:hypothetical protein n=1 Tax=Actinoplanes sp. NPDC051343 TaxID=3363906 RepID=UPI0037A8CC62